MRIRRPNNCAQQACLAKIAAIGRILSKCIIFELVCLNDQLQNAAIFAKCSSLAEFSLRKKTRLSCNCNRSLAKRLVRGVQEQGGIHAA